MNSPLALAVRVYKTLAHQVWLCLLAMLDGGGLYVCQMTAPTGLAASTLLVELSDRKAAGLLAERKLAVDRRVARALRHVGAEDLCRVELELGCLGIRRPFGALVRA
jgi:DNA-binding transcriptional ArsR family regulator